MGRNILTLLSGFVAVLVLSGCLTARTYVVNKQRVDQEIPGMPNQGPVKTRKVVVLEVIEKDKPQAKVEASQASQQAKAPASITPDSAASEESNFTLPQSAVPSKTEADAQPQVYVVEKDDTLQKISKKVYGSYSKWTKIYDANRDVLKDPNFLKSGIKLNIPVLEPAQAQVPAVDKKN